MKVKPGFFRNHLMPKLLAVPNIEKFAYLIREQRKVSIMLDCTFCITEPCPVFSCIHVDAEECLFSIFFFFF